MKKPRVEDFDPTAAPTLGSPLEGMPAIQSQTNTETSLQRPVSAPVMPIENSASDQPPIPTSSPIAPASMPSTQDPIRSPDRPDARTEARPYVGTPARRSISRCAFEFFQDQVQTLRKFSLEEKLRGEQGSMSEMVREALDMYIAKRNRT